MRLPVFRLVLQRRYGHSVVFLAVAAHWLWFAAAGVAVLAWTVWP